MQKAVTYQAYQKQRKPFFISHYPFLTGEQINAKLRQEWRKSIVSKATLTKPNECKRKSMKGKQPHKDPQLFSEFSSWEQNAWDSDVLDDGRLSPYRLNKSKIDKLNRSFRQQSRNSYHQSCLLTKPECSMEKDKASVRENDQNDFLKRTKTMKNYSGNVFRLDYPVPRIEFDRRNDNQGIKSIMKTSSCKKLEKNWERHSSPGHSDEENKSSSLDFDFDGSDSPYKFCTYSSFNKEEEDSGVCVENCTQAKSTHKALNNTPASSKINENSVRMFTEQCFTSTPWNGQDGKQSSQCKIEPLSHEALTPDATRRYSKRLQGLSVVKDCTESLICEKSKQNISRYDNSPDESEADVNSSVYSDDENIALIVRADYYPDTVTEKDEMIENPHSVFAVTGVSITHHTVFDADCGEGVGGEDVAQRGNINIEMDIGKQKLKAKFVRDHGGKCVNLEEEKNRQIQTSQRLPLVVNVQKERRVKRSTKSNYECDANNDIDVVQTARKSNCDQIPTNKHSQHDAFEWEEEYPHEEKRAKMKATKDGKKKRESVEEMIWDDSRCVQKDEVSDDACSNGDEDDDLFMSKIGFQTRKVLNGALRRIQSMQSPTDFIPTACKYKKLLSEEMTDDSSSYSDLEANDAGVSDLGASCLSQQENFTEGNNSCFGNDVILRHGFNSRSSIRESKVLQNGICSLTQMFEDPRSSREDAMGVNRRLFQSSDNQRCNNFGSMFDENDIFV